MSSDVTEGCEPDQYGQLHPVETPEMVSRKRLEFEQELARLPKDRTVNLRMAEEKCPQLLTDDFKLVFLRCEVFNADLAAARYAQYWDKRVLVMGLDRAFEPLNLHGNLKDSRNVFERSIIVPIRAENRTMLFLVMGNFDRQAYTDEEFLRALWYVFHAALEDVETQKRGLCIINFAKGFKASQASLPLAKRVIHDVQGCIPARLSANHICQPGHVFRTLFPIVSLFMGERLRKRVLPHPGSEAKVIQALEKYGIRKCEIPKALGGELEVDGIAWYQQRLAMGGGTLA